MEFIIRFYAEPLFVFCCFMHHHITFPPASTPVSPPLQAPGPVKSSFSSNKQGSNVNNNSNFRATHCLAWSGGGVSFITLCLVGGCDLAYPYTCINRECHKKTPSTYPSMHPCPDWCSPFDLCELCPLCTDR